MSNALAQWNAGIILTAGDSTRHVCQGLLCFCKGSVGCTDGHDDTNNKCQRCGLAGEDRS